MINVNTPKKCLQSTNRCDKLYLMYDAAGLCCIKSIILQDRGNLIAMDTLGYERPPVQRNSIRLGDCITKHGDYYAVLQRIAEEVLDEHYAPLKEFYSDVFFSLEYEYIVFVARRSIALAELFYIILWNETENQWQKDYLEKSWERATTDSTILSYCPEIAQAIKEAQRPRILVVDDVLVQGNGLNELLSGIEQGVLSALRSSGSVEDLQEIWREVGNAIQVRVFAQNTSVSVVKLQYQTKIRPMNKMDPQMWHDLSHKISNTIIATGVANASFIMGAEIFSTDAPNYEGVNALISGQLQLDPYTTIKPRSQNAGTLTERHYFGWSGVNPNKIRYFCSLRVIKNCYTEGYRLMPFVFLPQLSYESYCLLRERIFRKWQLSPDNGILNPNQEPTRLEYELMLLHLSESLLVSWAGRAGIQLDNSHFDAMKVALNYTLNRFNPMMDAEEFKRLTQPAYLFSWEELRDVLEAVTADVQAFEVSAIGQYEDTRKDLEDFVYEMKIQELTESYRYNRRVRASEEWSSGVSLAENRTHNWHITLEGFINRATSIKRFFHWASMENIICNLLSFMDEGIVTLKVRRSMDGYTQVIRMGEQSLFILPKRYEKYQKVLSYLKNRSIRSRRSFKEDLLDFLRHAQTIDEIPHDENVETLTEELIYYLRSLDESGQELEDWDIDFAEPAVLDQDDAQWSRRVGSLCIRKKLEEAIRWIEAGTLLDACTEYYPV